MATLGWNSVSTGTFTSPVQYVTTTSITTNGSLGDYQPRARTQLEQMRDEVEAYCKAGR